MPYCGHRSCTHCFSPGAEERHVLSYVIEAIEHETPHGIGNDWEPLSGHDDFYTSEFQAMSSAYEAGLKTALRILREELSRYET